MGRKALGKARFMTSMSPTTLAVVDAAAEAVGMTRADYIEQWAGQAARKQLGSAAATAIEEKVGRQAGPATPPNGEAARPAKRKR